MIKHRTAAILFSILLILGLSAIGTGRAYAAQQPARNPLYANQSAGQEPAADGENAAVVVEGSPTPLAQPIDGKNGPSPLMLCGIGAAVVAGVTAAGLPRQARHLA